MFRILLAIGASVGLNAPLDIHVPTKEELYIEHQEATRKGHEKVKEDNPYEDLERKERLEEDRRNNRYR